ncbi:DNA repair protein rad52 [Coemansia sp. RSA 1286]|nr:DNA repair protein rad52 [Coemansia sp. RSA 485]KAJ2601307.1 DNA repair protein rad52 [Coemansia sp. RSA 1721]KAJ2638594.1 DNA repair protein rad52 [Coemansia sp. RSA 1286]
MSNFSSAQTKTDSENQYGGTTFAFGTEEAARVQSLLRKKLGPEHVNTRQGMGGSRLSYIEGWRIISIANEVFGFNGWRSNIQNLSIDFMDMTESGKYSIGASCVVRVTLKDGTFREDVGYGMIENTKSKGQGLEKVKKEATTDGLKRAMRQFGNVLGNCVYDKDYVKNLMQVQKQSRGRIQGDNLFRYADMEDVESTTAQPNSIQKQIQAPPQQQQQQPQKPQQFQQQRQQQRQPMQHPPQLSGNAVQRQPWNTDDAAHRRIVGQQNNGTASLGNTGPMAGSRQPAEPSDFDMMDELDDDGMLDMIEDLETDRPVIHESPNSFGFARASNPQQLMTPIRSNMANEGSAPSSAASANAGAGVANPVLPRNLNIQLASANQQQALQVQSASSDSASRPIASTGGNLAESSSNAAVAAERPRSFADITPFIPTSQSSSTKSGLSHRLSETAIEKESWAKRRL